MASWKSSANGKRPNFSDMAAHAETTPGTVTLSHPISGICSKCSNLPRSNSCGDRPLPFSPCKADPSQIAQTRPPQGQPCARLAAIEIEPRFPLSISRSAKLKGLGGRGFRAGGVAGRNDTRFNLSLAIGHNCVLITYYSRCAGDTPE